MTVENETEPADSWFSRLPQGVRVALIVGGVALVLACLAGGITALADDPGPDRVSAPPTVAATNTVTPQVTATVAASASATPSPSRKPSPSTSVVRSPSPIRTTVKASPKPKLVVTKLSVTAQHVGENIVATVKVTTTGYGTATIEVMFFFSGSVNVDRQFTVTGTGSNTITKQVSVPNNCRPGYTGSVWVGISDSAVQDSVDVC